MAATSKHRSGYLKPPERLPKPSRVDESISYNCYGYKHGNYHKFDKYEVLQFMIINHS